MVLPPLVQPTVLSTPAFQSNVIPFQRFLNTVCVRHSSPECVYCELCLRHATTALNCSDIETPVNLQSWAGRTFSGAQRMCDFEPSHDCCETGYQYSIWSTIPQLEALVAARRIRRGGEGSFVEGVPTRAEADDIAPGDDQAEA